MRPLPNNEIQEKQQVYVKQYPKCESVKQNKGIIREPDASRAKNKKKKIRTVGIWPVGRKLPISACDLGLDASNKFFLVNPRKWGIYDILVRSYRNC